MTEAGVSLGPWNPSGPRNRRLQRHCPDPGGCSVPLGLGAGVSGGLGVLPGSGQARAARRAGEGRGGRERARAPHTPPPGDAHSRVGAAGRPAPPAAAAALDPTGVGPAAAPRSSGLQRPGTSPGPAVPRCRRRRLRRRRCQPARAVRATRGRAQPERAGAALRSPEARLLARGACRPARLSQAVRGMSRRRPRAVGPRAAARLPRTPPRRRGSAPAAGLGREAGGGAR